jgi:hypothetical protein
MPERSVPELRRDLLDTFVAVLATNGADGRPGSPRWAFYHDPNDDRVKISLKRHAPEDEEPAPQPNTTLFILDLNNPRRTPIPRVPPVTTAQRPLSACGAKTDFTTPNPPTSFAI